LRKRWLILFNVFYFISIALIVVLGPFYSGYSTEQLIGFEPTPAILTYPLNFTFSQEYDLVAPTFLDWESVIVVNFTSTQPIYVVVAEEAALSFYDKSTFGNGSDTLVYHVPEPGNYTVSAEAFGGTANVVVTIYLSIVARSKPYFVWGQVMYYGGIGLLIGSLAFIVLSWVRKEKPPKQSTQAVAARKER
jgi:hypothetical protein